MNYRNFASTKVFPALLGALTAALGCAAQEDSDPSCEGQKCDDVGQDGSAAEEMFAPAPVDGSEVPLADPVVTFTEAFYLMQETTGNRARLYRKVLTAGPDDPAALLYESAEPVFEVRSFHRDQKAGGSNLYWMEESEAGARIRSILDAAKAPTCQPDACDNGRVKSYQTDQLLGFAISPGGGVRIALVETFDENSGASNYEFRSLNSNFAEIGAIFRTPSYIDSDSPESDREAIRGYSGVPEIASLAVDDKANIYYCYGNQLRRGSAGKPAVVLQDMYLGANRTDPVNNEFNTNLLTDCSYVTVVGTSRLVWSHFGTEGTKEVDGGWVFSSALSSASSVSTPLAPKAFGGATAQSTLVLGTPSFYFDDDAGAKIHAMSVFPTSNDANGNKVNKPLVTFVKGNSLYAAVDDHQAELPNSSAFYSRDAGLAFAPVYHRASDLVYFFSPHGDLYRVALQ